MGRSKVALIVAIFVFFISINSFANDNYIHIQADHVSYNKNLSTYFAYGHCRIYDMNYILTADKVSYNDNTSIAEARGNVLMKDSKGDWIRGSYAWLNYSTYHGYVNNAVLFVKSDHLYIRASRIVMYGKDKYYIKDGSITSCRCPGFVEFKNSHPKWTVNASNTYIVRNDYLFSYPVLLKAKSVPVFFLPFLRKNLNKKRKTGFLFPQVGYSSTFGYKYIQPFFINLSDSQDITLYPFAFSREGNGIKAQYRFYWTRHSKGEWNITVLKEKVPYTGSLSKLTRVNLKAIQYADFGKYGYFNYDVNIVNNRNNLRVIDMSNLEISSDRYTTSQASYYWNKGPYFLSLYGKFYQDLVAQNNKATLQKLPVLKFGVIGKKLFRNLTLDFTQTVSNDFRITGARGVYTDSSGFLYYPFKIGYFSITPKIGAHQIYSRWKYAPLDKHYSRRAFVPEYDLSASTELFGVFLNENQEVFKGVKHTIKPTISYQYIPERSQRFPDFVTTYAKTNKITFTLENTLTGKFLNDETPTYRQLFYNRITAYYDFAKQYHTPFPPIYEETIIKPLKFLTLSSQAHYFFKKHEFLDSSESINLAGSSAGLQVGYSMSRDADYNLSDETVDSKVYVYPVKELYLYASFKRSVRYSYFPSRKFGFLYQEDCWGVGLDFYLTRTSEENSNGTFTTHLDKGFWLTLNLTGLFSVKRQY